MAPVPSRPVPSRPSKRSIRSGKVIRSISTRRAKNARRISPMQKDKTRRLLVSVLQAVARDGPFDNYGDMLEAFKVRCARLHIRYTPPQMNAAVAQLEHEGLLPVRTQPKAPPVETPKAQITISREEAHQI